MHAPRVSGIVRGTEETIRVQELLLSRERQRERARAFASLSRHVLRPLEPEGQWLSIFLLPQNEHHQAVIPPSGAASPFRHPRHAELPITHRLHRHAIRIQQFPLRQHELPVIAHHPVIIQNPPVHAREIIVRHLPVRGSR